VLLDCVIYCAFYSILFRGAVFSGHGVKLECREIKELIIKYNKVEQTLLLAFITYMVILIATASAVNMYIYDTIRIIRYYRRVYCGLES